MMDSPSGFKKFERTPDEKGIKTRAPRRTSLLQVFERTPDEKGIKTERQDVAVALKPV